MASLDVKRRAIDSWFQSLLTMRGINTTVVAQSVAETSCSAQTALIAPSASVEQLHPSFNSIQLSVVLQLYMHGSKAPHVEGLIKHCPRSVRLSVCLCIANVLHSCHWATYCALGKFCCQMAQKMPKDL